MPRFRDTEPFFHTMGGRIDPLYEIRNAGIITSGDVFWVKKNTDPDYVTLYDAVGGGNIRDDIQNGYNLTTSDQNDYVFICPGEGGTAWSLGTALDLDEDRTHLLSTGYGRGGNGYLNQLLTSTGTTPDSEVIAVTGNSVELAGFHVKGTVGTHAGGTLTNGVLYVNAHDFWGHDLYVELNQNAKKDSMALNFGGTKHGAYFNDCQFSVTGTGNAESATSGVVDLADGGKRFQFHNCVISEPAGSSSDVMIASGTGAKEWTLFRDCDFINTDVSFSVASAITGSTTTDNPVLCVNCTVVACAQIGTNAAIYVAPAASGTLNKAYNPNVAVGTALVVAS